MSSEGIGHEAAQPRRGTERNEAIALTILRDAVDPVIVIDTVGSIVEANAATTRLLGWQRDELLGNNVKMLMPDPYQSEHDGYLRSFLDTGEKKIIGIGREVVAKRADGTTLPISLAVTEVKTGDAHLFTGIIHDLTERNRQRDELEAANERLESRVAERTGELEESLANLARSNRDLEQFASVASHDLQAPLRNVRQGLELLDEHLQETAGVAFDQEATELRTLVIDAVSRMEDLIHGLLEFSRLQGDQTAEPVGLNDVLVDVRRALALDLEDASATLEAGDLPTVLANQVQIRRVLQNLVANAIRYRSPDRPLVISIEAGDTDARSSLVPVTVIDNGIGIDPMHHDRVFELFRRAHPGYEGVGLGLAICRRVIESFGGTIGVESQSGDGARFTFTLPAAT